MRTFDTAQAAFHTNPNAVTAFDYMRQALNDKEHGLIGDKTFLSVMDNIGAYLSEQITPVHRRAAFTGMHIVITGNPVVGFHYIGPFKTGDAAADWPNSIALGADWWIAPLEAKETYKEPDDAPTLPVVDGDENADVYGHASNEEEALTIARATFVDPIKRVYLDGPIALATGETIPQAWVALVDDRKFRKA